MRVCVDRDGIWHNHLYDMGDSFYVNIFYWKGGFDEFLIKLLECYSAKRGENINACSYINGETW